MDRLHEDHGKDVKNKMTKIYSTKTLEQIKENNIVGFLATKAVYLPRLGDDDEKGR